MHQKGLGSVKYIHLGVENVAALVMFAVTMVAELLEAKWAKATVRSAPTTMLEATAHVFTPVGPEPTMRPMAEAAMGAKSTVGSLKTSSPSSKCPGMRGVVEFPPWTAAMATGSMTALAASGMETAVATVTLAFPGFVMVFLVGGGRGGFVIFGSLGLGRFFVFSHRLSAAVAAVVRAMAAAMGQIKVSSTSKVFAMWHVVVVVTGEEGVSKAWFFHAGDDFPIGRELIEITDVGHVDSCVMLVVVWICMMIL